MLRYLLARTASSVSVLFVSTVMLYVVITSAGDPLAPLRDRQPPVPQSVLDAESARLGLDDPLPVRYLNWLTGLFRGDFGPSVVANRDIGAELASRMGMTFQLVALAVIIAALLALVLGTVSAMFRGRLLDRVFTPLTFLLLALPSFWLAVIVKQGGIAINKSLGFMFFPTVGSGSLAQGGSSVLEVLDAGRYVILPTLVLALVHFAVWSRYQRAAILTSLQGEHVRFALLRGVRRSTIVRDYVVRPALIPIVTVIALDLPVIVSGAVVTEMVFQWKGMGAFLLDSIEVRDLNAIMGWLLVAGTAVVLCNLLADILYSLIDPRVRRGT